MSSHEPCTVRLGNLEPPAAATHTHGRALASCERAGTMGVSAVWPTHAPRATQRGCRQGVACDRPGVGWGEGFRWARGCPGRMWSTGSTVANGGGASRTP